MSIYWSRNIHFCGFFLSNSSGAPRYPSLKLGEYPVNPYPHPHPTRAKDQHYQWAIAQVHQNLHNMTEEVQKRYFEVGRSLTEVISLVALGLGAIEPTKHHRRL